ncbi:MAG: RsmB/NOP family class I SAM-dependent RNA methyltransferase, partial [Pseudomonadota bacterium]
MTPAARHAAAITILDDVLNGSPTERALTRWARASRFAGSKDRAAVRDIVFNGVRRMRSAAALGGGRTGRDIVLGLLRAADEDVDAIFSGQGHAPAPLSPEEASAGQNPLHRAERLDYPDWMDPLLEKALGSDLERIMALHQQRAPVGLRVNLAHGSREAAAQLLLRHGVETEPDPDVATALRVMSGGRAVSQSEA